MGLRDTLGDSVILLRCASGGIEKSSAAAGGAGATGPLILDSVRRLYGK